MGFTLRPAEGDTFVDREELLEEILWELRNKDSTTGFAIYGKRRVGKTSIFRELKRRLKREPSLVVVYFSLWDLIEYNVEEFCRKLAAETIDAYRPKLGLKFKAVELLRTPLSVLRKISELRVAYEDIEFIVSFRGEDLEELVERTFNLPEKLAKRTSSKCVLLLDEFPAVMDLKAKGTKVGEGVVRKIRTISEDWHNVAMCISGSIRSTLATVALEAASPFYRQFIAREIGPVKTEYLMQLLRKNLDIDEEAALRVCKFSGGMPFYVQFLGKMLERKKNRINIEDVEKAVQEFLTEEGDLLFREEFERISVKERLILAAIAQGKRSPSDMVEIIGDKVSNVSVFLKYLIDKGYVRKRRKGCYEIEDPVFEEWLKRREVL